MSSSGEFLRNMEDPQERPAIPGADWDYTLVQYDEHGAAVYGNQWPRLKLPTTNEAGEVTAVIEAHQTNNLLVNILQAKKVRDEIEVRKRTGEEYLFYGRAYEFYIRNNGLDIFSVFEDHYPDLHTHLLDINRRLLDPDEAKTTDLYLERDIQCSIAYEHLADIATALYPHFDINLLTV